jgi:hypothetical protein
VQAPPRLQQQHCLSVESCALGDGIAEKAGINILAAHKSWQRFQKQDSKA